MNVNCILSVVLQLPKSDITAYLKTQTVPQLSTDLYYCPRATKLQWKKGKYTLGENGIYTITVSDTMVTPLIRTSDKDTLISRTLEPQCLFHFQKSGAQQLCAGLDYHMYTPTPEAGQSLTTPTRFCFAMKASPCADHMIIT